MAEKPGISAVGNAISNALRSHTEQLRLLRIRVERLEAQQRQADEALSMVPGHMPAAQETGAGEQTQSPG